MSLHENIVITKQEEQEHQKCTICWNKMKSSYTTSCNHEFCHKCIKKTLKHMKQHRVLFVDINLMKSNYIL